MTYGVTPTGLVRPSVQELLDERNAAQKAGISQAWDTSPESIQGQANAIGCQQLGVAWEALEILAGSIDPDKAEEWLLTAVCKLTGTWRNPATKSTVHVFVSLDADTTLVAGEHFARVTGRPTVRFTPRETFTAELYGYYTLVFEAETPGPVAVEPDTLTVIATNVPGWLSVTNPNPATLGTVEEDDPSLRRKRDQELNRAGNQTEPAVRSDLLALRYPDETNGKQWIKNVGYWENTDNITDSDGRPPHSFEVLVYDDPELRPGDANNQIAQAIWTNKPAGINIWGTGGHTGEVIDAKGVTQVVPFSRVTLVPIYIRMSLTTVSGFIGSGGYDLVKAAIVTRATAEFARPGADVVSLFIRSIPLTDVSGVIDVPTFTIGTSPSPTSNANVALGLRQVPLFTVGNITII